MKGGMARMEEKRNAYGILVGKREGKIQLERFKSAWLNNIWMSILEIGQEGLHWMQGYPKCNYEKTTKAWLTFVTVTCFCFSDTSHRLVISRTAKRRRGAPKQGTGGGCNPFPRSKFKEHRFCKHDGSQSFTSSTLPPKQIIDTRVA